MLGYVNVRKNISANQINEKKNNFLSRMEDVDRVQLLNAKCAYEEFLYYYEHFDQDPVTSYQMMKQCEQFVTFEFSNIKDHMRILLAEKKPAYLQVMTESEQCQCHCIIL